MIYRFSAQEMVKNRLKAQDSQVKDLMNWNQKPQTNYNNAVHHGNNFTPNAASRHNREPSFYQNPQTHVSNKYIHINISPL